MLSFSGFEEENDNERIQLYYKSMQEELKGQVQINVNMREEEIMMYAMRNIYKFIEIHQQ